jgi:hypothetical protein
MEKWMGCDARREGGKAIRLRTAGCAACLGREWEIAMELWNAQLPWQHVTQTTHHLNERELALSMLVPRESAD